MKAFANDSGSDVAFGLLVDLIGHFSPVVDAVLYAVMSDLLRCARSATTDAD